MKIKLYYTKQKEIEVQVDDEISFKDLYELASNLSPEDDRGWEFSSYDVVDVVT